MYSDRALAPLQQNLFVSSQSWAIYFNGSGYVNLYTPEALHHLAVSHMHIMNYKDQVLKLLPTAYLSLHPLSDGYYYEIWFRFNHKGKEHKDRIVCNNESEEMAWKEAFEYIQINQKELKIYKGNFLEFRLYGLESFLKKAKVKAVTKPSNPKKSICIQIEGDSKELWIPLSNFKGIARSSISTGKRSGFGFSEDLTIYHILELNSWAIENIILKQ